MKGCSDEGAGILAPVKGVQQSSMPNALPPHGSFGQAQLRRQALVTCLSKMQPWKQGSIVILVKKKTESREKPNEQKTIQGRSSKVSDEEKLKN